MREIKFRAWLPEIKKMTYPMTIAELVGGHATSGTTPVWLQFTGLHDKNGKEIYEGDILLHGDMNWGYGGEYDRIHDGYLREVVPDIDELLKGNWGGDVELMECWEVIGNIHENADLLAEGKSCAG